MNKVKTKKLTFIALFTAIVMLAAAFYFAPLSTKRARAEDNLPVEEYCPDADFEYIITANKIAQPETFEAQAAGNTNVLSHENISELIKLIDSDADAAYVEVKNDDADGKLTKKLIFDGGEDLAMPDGKGFVNIGANSCILTSGNYIIEGKLISSAGSEAGTNINYWSTVRLSGNNVSLFVAGEHTVIENSHEGTASANRTRVINNRRSNDDGTPTNSYATGIRLVLTDGKIIGDYGIGSDGTMHTTIMGGRVEGRYSGILINNNFSSSRYDLDVCGGTITGGTYGIYNNSGAKWRIGETNPAIPTLIESAGYAIYARVQSSSISGTMITVSGGSISNTGSGSAFYFRGLNTSLTHDGALEIIGGEIYNVGSGDALYIHSGTVNISGGKIMSDTGSAIYKAEEQMLTVSGDAFISSANTTAASGTIRMVSTTTVKSAFAFLGGVIANTAGRTLVGIGANGATVTIGEGPGAITKTSGSIAFDGLSDSTFTYQPGVENEPGFTLSGLTEDNFTKGYRDNIDSGIGYATAMLDHGLGCAEGTRFEGGFVIDKAVGNSDMDTANVTYSQDLKVEDVSEIAALIADGYTFADAGDILTVADSPKTVVGCKDNVDPNYEDSITVTITVNKAAGNSTTDTVSVTYNPSLTVSDVLGDYSEYIFSDASDSLTVADSGKVVIGYKDNADPDNYEQDSVTVTIIVEQAEGDSTTDTVTVTYASGLTVADALGDYGDYTFTDASDSLTVADSGRVVIGYKDNADPNYRDSIAVTITVDKAQVAVEQPTFSGTLVYGDSLPVITTITLGGTIALDAGQTLTVGTADYAWTFTPVDTDNYEYTSELTGVISLTVNKFTPTAPSIPAISGEPEKDSVTIKTIVGAEYSIDGGATWQDSPTFTNLNANTEYTVIARIKATANGNTSAASAVCTFTTAKNNAGGLSGGAVAGIVIGSVLLMGLGGFAIFWFVIKKKSFNDLLEVFKKNKNS